MHVEQILAGTRAYVTPVVPLESRDLDDIMKMAAKADELAVTLLDKDALQTIDWSNPDDVTLLPEDWITDNVHIEAMADEGGQLINAATQVVPPVMTARHTQTQWIRSMLVLCLGLGFLYSPMPMEISLIDLAFLPLVVLITGYVARNALCSCTTTRRALGISIWANLPFSKSIPILPIIDAHRV